MIQSMSARPMMTRQTVTLAPRQQHAQHAPQNVAPRFGMGPGMFDGMGKALAVVGTLVLAAGVGIGILATKGCNKAEQQAQPTQQQPVQPKTDTQKQVDALQQQLKDLQEVDKLQHQIDELKAKNNK